MDVNVNVEHEVDGGGVVRTVGMLAGIGLGIVCGGAAGSFIASKLPEAVTTFEKIRNGLIVAGTSITVQHLVSEAVVADISETVDMAASAAAKTQAKLEEKQAKTAKN